MDGIKQTFKFPEFMELTNISTIYKNKGSRYDLENDRGIFILSVLRKLLDKLIYEEKYPEIDCMMSDSNIGAREGKNCIVGNIQPILLISIIITGRE